MLAIVGDLVDAAILAYAAHMSYSRTPHVGHLESAPVRKMPMVALSAYRTNSARLNSAAPPMRIAHPPTRSAGWIIAAAMGYVLRYRRFARIPQRSCAEWRQQKTRRARDRDAPG